MSRTIYNLTDIETAKLTQRSLVNAAIAVGEQMTSPGDAVEVDDATFDRCQSQLEVFVGLGALAIDELPAKYKLAKQQAAAVPPPSDGSAADAPGTSDAAPAAEEAPRFRKSK